MTREELLNKVVNVYDIDAIIKQGSEGKYQGHMIHNVALLEKQNGGYILADYEAICVVEDNEGLYHIEIEETEGTTPDKNGHYTIHIFGCGWYSFKIEELLQYAPIYAIKGSEFFTKRDYNPRCIYNFENMIKLLNE